MSISGIFGLPGSGKSVFLTKCVLDALNHKPTIVGGSVLQGGNYSQILTNFQIDGCKILEWDKLGKAEIRDTLIVCDEIMIYADSRKFKTFTDDLTFFFLNTESSVLLSCGLHKLIEIVTYVFGI